MAKFAKHSKRLPSPDDSVLDTDSEEDEFAAERNPQNESDDDVAGSDPEDDQEDEEHGGRGQWQPDDWDGEGESGSEGSVSEDEASADEAQSSASEDDDTGEMARLQNDLTSLPFDSVIKARRALKRVSDPAPKNAKAGPSMTKERRLAMMKAKLASMQQRKGKAAHVSPIQQGDLSGEEGDSDDEPETEFTSKGRREKRDNKHAPSAMSSKRQVSRHRQVVEIGKTDRRDPRFSSVSAGAVNPHLHSQSYDFLPTLLQDELSGLKLALATAVKAERTCSWAEKGARTAERERLEQQLGKVRTRLDRTKREAREREVLSKVKKEEKEKRAAGKGAWYMKKGEKRDLLLKSRFDALEAQGGKTAVKKAMEKKRKKTAQQEKKSRPFKPTKRPRAE